MREKLIELFYKAEEQADKRCDFAENCDKCPADNHPGIDCMDWLKADCLIANGVTVQKWIPVTERLPEEWVSVLVWSWCGFCETAVYLGIPGKWRVTWNHTMLDEDTITHWMPLPEPPNE